MNNTKKLTTGAMLLAIVGAVMLIDRQLSFLFEELIIMLAPSIIIIYSAMYDIKDGAILSVSLLIVGFLLGSTYTFCYMPISVIVGLGYSFGIKKNFNKTKLMLVSMILFIIGEVIVTFVVTPIIGLSIPQQLAELRTIYEETLSKTGYSIEVFNQIGINIDSLLLVVFVISTLLMGVGEGFIIHILSLFLLSRFKIKEIEKGSLINLNLNPALAYVCFIAFASMIFVSRIDNETVKLVLITLSLLGSVVLAYYGYIFVIVYLKFRSGRKSVGLLVVLAIILGFPLSIIILVIIGFLYGSGPLKRSLEKLSTNNNERN